MMNIDMVMKDELLTKEDEQVLHEAFVFIPTAKTVWTKTNNVDPIATVKVKTINKIQVDMPLIYLLDTCSTGTMIQSRVLSLMSFQTSLQRRE